MILRASFSDAITPYLYRNRLIASFGLFEISLKTRGGFRCDFSHTTLLSLIVFRSGFVGAEVKVTWPLADNSPLPPDQCLKLNMSSTFPDIHKGFSYERQNTWFAYFPSVDVRQSTL